MRLVPWHRSPLSRRSAEPLFDRFFDDGFRFGDHLPEALQSASAPAVNIAENEKALTVSAELPGLEEKDIDVQVMGNQLVISAERKFEAEKKEKEFLRVEHQYGSFSRTITLPTGLRTDAVEAVYKKGILTVEIPKLEPTPTAKIEVKTG
jgi:HSP20 family protein